VEHIAALLSPDLEWTGAESFPYYSGLWRGPQAVIDNLLLPLARDWDGFSATRTNFSLATSVSRAALARAGQTAAMA
jgi:hypothetical protein